MNDNSLIKNNLTGALLPFTFGLEAHSDANGLLMDYISKTTDESPVFIFFFLKQRTSNCSRSRLGYLNYY